MLNQVRLSKEKHSTVVSLRSRNTICPLPKGPISCKTNLSLRFFFVFRIKEFETVYKHRYSLKHTILSSVHTFPVWTTNMQKQPILKVLFLILLWCHTSHLHIATYSTYSSAPPIHIEVINSVTTWAALWMRCNTEQSVIPELIYIVISFETQ